MVDDDEALDPIEMLACMAASDEGRMRLALIPLLLRREEMAQVAPAAVERCTGRAQITLTCYYAAAMLLQEKYTDQLLDMGLPSAGMPDWFCAGLDVPVSGDVQQRLEALAGRQAVLTGDELNWLGTYEHGATSFLKLHGWK